MKDYRWKGMGTKRKGKGEIRDNPGGLREERREKRGVAGS